MVTITIQGPGKNALSTAVMDDLLAQLDAAREEPLLVTGAGDAFSAGLNLKEVASLDAAGMRGFLTKFEALVARLYGHPAPTAAAVNGHAIAGGCVLALCCDARVATRGKAKIGLNELAIGARFPPLTLALVRDRLSKRYLDTVVLGAALVDGEGAARVGIVNEVAEDPLAVGRQRLEALAAHPRASYAAVKRDLHAPVLAAAATCDWDELISIWMHPETRQRMQAQLAR